MAASLDVDAFCKSDPERAFALARDLGQGSPFEAEIVWGGSDGSVLNTGGQWFGLPYFVKN